MSEEREPLQPLSPSQMEALEEAVSSYEAAVTVEVVEYLQSRGIGELEAVTHRLGVVGDPFPGHGRFRGMLVIPYLDKNGKPLSVRFRCMEDHNHREAHFSGKYSSIAGEPTRVYNVGAIFKATDTIHVTEGELDAVILNKVGLPAVAIAGANAWKGHHRRMLAGFNRVWVWGDPDDAGAEFVQKVTKSLRQARGVHLSHGDVTDTYLALGEDALLELVETREEAA